MLRKLVKSCSENNPSVKRHVDCCVCNRLEKEAAKDAAEAGEDSTAPAQNCPTAQTDQPEEAINLAAASGGAAEHQPPAGGPETPAVVEDIPLSTEQVPPAGEDLVPAVDDPPTAAAGGNTTIPLSDAEAEGLKRMDEVVGELPPIPLKLLVLAFLTGDSWKQSKASEAAETGEHQEQPQNQAPAGTSSIVSTRE
jgi:hypothetical protein